LYRGALMGREITSFDLWASVGWAVGMLVIGVLAFVRYEGNMVRHL
jgi:hypothetical protein